MKKKNDSEDQVLVALSSDVFKQWQASGRYLVEYIQEGYWPNFPGYGELDITRDSLREGAENFRALNKKPFLDYDHGITNPTMSSRPGIAAGWMADLYIGDDEGEKVAAADVEEHSGRLSLWAVYEVVKQANDELKEGLWALFSPTFSPRGVDKKTGKAVGFVAHGGALTNIPWFDGMTEPRLLAASARVAGAVAASMHGSAWVVSVRIPDSGATLSAKLEELDRLGYAVDSVWRSAGESPAYAASGRGQDKAGGGTGRTDAGANVEANQKGERKMKTYTSADLAKILNLGEVGESVVEEKISSLAASAPKDGEMLVATAAFEKLKQDAARGNSAFDRLHANERDTALKSAIEDFKIPKVKEKEWIEAYDRDPVGTKTLLDTLQPNPAFKGGEQGSAGGGDGHGGEIRDGARSTRDSALNATMRKVDEKADKIVEASGGKTDIVTARRRVFDENPTLYASYRSTQRVRSGDADEE